MARTTIPYLPLPGRGSAGLQRCRLWLGPDHLLLVAASAIGERYKRFYFADIQAVVLQRKWSFPAAALLWLPMVLVLAISLSITSVRTQAQGVLGALIGATAALLVAFLLHVWLRGRGVKCYIRTAVQNEHLPTLHRPRTAEKVLARIRPLIEAAQTGTAATSTPEGR
jgi:hypothetical protein